MNRTLLVTGALVILLAGAGVFFLTGSDKTPTSSSVEQIAARTPDELIDAAHAAFLGEGTAQSDEAGAQLILQAARAGDEHAIGFAGTLYMGGIGVDHDITKAREWLSKSTDEEALALAEALMTFEAVLATMPEEQAELQKAMDETDARDDIRSSFIAALERHKMARAETSTGAESSIEAAADENADENAEHGEDHSDHDHADAEHIHEEETAEDASAEENHKADGTGAE
ncbi:MAG: hypothetical protein RBS08_05265 [Bdellovibrionales bacterium]|jgi:TPR repeat protein|nr:hypothetical protein [Bdellovibrionales bacterium]